MQRHIPTGEWMEIYMEELAMGRDGGVEPTFTMTLCGLTAEFWDETPGHYIDLQRDNITCTVCALIAFEKGGKTNNER